MTNSIQLFKEYTLWPMLLGCTFGFALGLIYANALILDDCKRKNSVYACEVIAAPVKGGNP